ncbi:hypothetical protein HFD88_003452 [Aspergillus terreus]|nr:hypothetical protein HFD88_003452 [Aspergillus terreus]
MGASRINKAITAECDQSGRRDLLTELRDLLELPEVTPVAWGCLWFADLSRLRDMISMARTPPGRAALRLALGSLGPDFVKTWLDRAVPRCSSTSALSATFAEGGSCSSMSSATCAEAAERASSEWKINVKRKFGEAFGGDEMEEEDGEEYEEGECFERDKRCCAVTRIAWRLEVAHIVPSIGTTTPASVTFWDTLALFWHEERVRNWAWEVNAPRSCANRMCMASHVHDAWKQARFALKPTSFGVGRDVSVTFYWLNCKTPPSKVDLLERPTLTGTRVDEGTDSLKFWENVDDEKICSGGEFDILTSDPDRHPLPSWGLLEMQWFLQRIVAFSGLAHPLEEDESADEEEEDYDTPTEGSSDIAEEEDAEALKKELADLIEEKEEYARSPVPVW